MPGYPGQQGGFPPAPGFGGAYPGMPMFPGAPPLVGTPGPVATRPTSVSIAFWLWILQVLVGVLSVILLFTSNEFARALQDADVALNDTVARDALNVVRVVAVIFGLIFAGLFLLFAFRMRAGRNWARVVLTVLGALSLISNLSSAGGTTTINDVRVTIRPASVVAVGWVSAVVAIIAIVLMFVGGANQYFTAMRASRMYR